MINQAESNLPLSEPSTFICSPHLVKLHSRVTGVIFTYGSVTPKCPKEKVYSKNNIIRSLCRNVFTSQDGLVNRFVYLFHMKSRNLFFGGTGNLTGTAKLVTRYCKEAAISLLRKALRRKTPCHQAPSWRIAL